MPWPTEIQPEIRSPYSILQQEAQGLEPQTRGILVAEVSADAPEGEKRIKLHLDIIVPALNNYRRRILTASYDKNMVYPVTVDADCFRPRSLAEVIAPLTEIHGSSPKRANSAATDEEFSQLVDKVLHSDEVKSLAVSLIALANERLKGPASLVPANSPPLPAENALIQGGQTVSGGSD